MNGEVQMGELSERLLQKNVYGRLSLPATLGSLSVPMINQLCGCREDLQAAEL